VRKDKSYTMYQTLKNFGKAKIQEPLCKHTTFKIGGPADFFVTVEKIDKLQELLAFLDGEGQEYFILGGGSNMLARDEGFRGVVIEVKDKTIEQEGDEMIACAGAVTVEVAQQSMKGGLTGFEWGVGVPGTIGGAVRGNAGAMGSEMKDNVKKVLLYKDGSLHEYDNDACGFEYRSSIFKREGGIILKVWLKLKKGENIEGKKKMLEFLRYRNTTQPQGYASTGCIFKNVEFNETVPKGAYNRKKLLEHFDKENEKVQQFLSVGKISAGWLVQEAGCKGYQVGQAQVSEKHGNFIINLGGATSHDVLKIIEMVKEKVYNTYGIELEEEIQIV